MRTNLKNRTVQFRFEDGCLVRTVASNDGRTYTHRCGKDAFETVAHAMCETPAEGEGTTLTCLIIDMSVSGVAVSAEIVPALDTPVAVGRVVGRVRRHFTEGFAIEFLELQKLDTLPHRLLRR